MKEYQANIHVLIPPVSSVSTAAQPNTAVDSFLFPSGFTHAKSEWTSLPHYVQPERWSPKIPAPITLLVLSFLQYFMSVEFRQAKMVVGCFSSKLKAQTLGLLACLPPQFLPLNFLLPPPRCSGGSAIPCHVGFSAACDEVHPAMS